MPGISETHALWMQRRSMRLLIQHDPNLLRHQFRLFYTRSTAPPLPLLQQYDRYVRLSMLSSELLDDILPRIRRSLSLRTCRTRQHEEAPTRGEIDWPRTIERTGHTLPGSHPLSFDTRLRHQNVATPENILVVAILLAFQQALRQAQHEWAGGEPLTREEQQALKRTEERVRRELSAPYAHTLLPHAQRSHIKTLVSQVSRRLPNHSRPYRDLMSWWHRFNDLHIGRGRTKRHPTATSHDESLSWLYHLWTNLELLHLLHEERAIDPGSVTIRSHKIAYIFTWNGQRYCYHWSRESAPVVPAGPDWCNRPALEAGAVFERENPLEIIHEHQRVWREPPVVLHIAYSTEGGRRGQPALLKALLSDMLVAGVQYGLLLAPCLPPPSAASPLAGSWHAPHDDRSAGPRQVDLVGLVPDCPRDEVRASLLAVLNAATHHLPARPTPSCHGVWLDPDSTNANNSPVVASSVLCPRPHVGPDAFVLTNVETDCLKNPRVCHAIGQSIVPPLVIRASTPSELFRQSTAIRNRSNTTLQQAEDEGHEEHAEQLRTQIFTGIGRAVEQYARVHGNLAAIEDYFEQWIFGIYWRSHARCLAAETRSMLLSGEYVWQEYRQAYLDDWAAPSIQYCRALELELRRRLGVPEPQAYRPRRWSLGMPLHAYQHRSTHARAWHNWELLTERVAQSGSALPSFGAVLQQMIDRQLVPKRNLLAHGERTQRETAELLRLTILGTRSEPGILCWITEHLEPSEPTAPDL